MTRDELIERLKGHEWRDIEFKAAQFEVPRDVYTTVSAFANTEGGHIVFGVKGKKGGFEIVGVIPDCVDNVQNAFLNTIRSGNKVSVIVPVRESIIQDDAGTVLVFFIPEANRKEKPVHLDGRWEESYIRRGASDQRCTVEEVKRFIRDASSEPFDGEPIEDISAETFFDEEVVAWYRGVFNRREPGRHEALSDVEFLRDWGFIIEKQKALTPNRAGILFFGKARYVRQILSRPVVDFQRIDFPSDEWTPEKRWNDRVIVEENLVRAWWLLVDRFMKVSERPFSIDATTMRRDDEPPDYISFREAAINLLMHQDYGDHGRLARIQIFRDRTVFWNPGDAFYTKDQLLDTGTKAVRNQNIVNAFRRIGLSDQAGTGIRAIYKNWNALGNVPPEMDNNRAEKTFELILKREPLFTERQRTLQATLGVHLSEAEAEAFAYACKMGRLSVTDVRSLTTSTAAEATAILDRLVLQVLLKAVDSEAGIYELQDQFKTTQACLPSEQVEANAGHLPTEQVGKKGKSLPSGQVRPLTELAARQWDILALCDMPRSLKELLELAGIKSRNYFVSKYLQPMLDARLIRMTNPESRTAPNQRYVLTKTGLELNAWAQDNRKRPDK
ncbi:MAG: RNA-binding domain-containing protein [Pseudomonadota bacterium]